MSFFPAKISVCGCQTFTACAVRHLQVSTSRNFVARPFVHSRVSVFAAFSALCSGEFCIFLLPRSPPICRLTLVNWARIAHSSDGRFSAYLLHLDMAGSLSAFLLVQVFPLCRSSGSGTRWLVRGFLPIRHHIVQSRRFHISCTVVGGFFFFVGVPVRPIAG